MRVRRDTDYLVAGNGAGKTKTDAAARLGVTQISQYDLYNLIGILP